MNRECLNVDPDGSVCRHFPERKLNRRPLSGHRLCRYRELLSLSRPPVHRTLQLRTPFRNIVIQQTMQCVGGGGGCLTLRNLCKSVPRYKLEAGKLTRFCIEKHVDFCRKTMFLEDLANPFNVLTTQLSAQIGSFPQSGVDIDGDGVIGSLLAVPRFCSHPYFVVSAAVTISQTCSRERDQFLFWKNWAK